uniref:Uncharacterized protein n=1 Tax=Rhizophora mucronata TaxID=61149 RepID=A0A2P2N512_RHIMU
MEERPTSQSTELRNGLSMTSRQGLRKCPRVRNAKAYKDENV